MLLAGVPLIPELFLDYQQEEIRDKNALVTSGLMVTNAAIQAEFAKGGKICDYQVPSLTGKVNECVKDVEEIIQKERIHKEKLDEQTKIQAEI